MKNLLVAFELDTACQAPWATALSEAAASIAGLFDSYIEVVGITPPLPPSMLAGEVTYGLADAIKPCTEAEAHVEFERAFTPLSATRACNWAGTLASAEIGSHARPFDLVIMVRLGFPGEGPKRDALESALFESGRPLLLVSEPTRTGRDVVVVSWTDTVETARAMTASLPLLQRARTVHLLSVQKHNELPSTADAAAHALRRHGVQVECASVPERGSVGEAVLAFARQVDADLLIKGAYTQARLRRLIFGGATDYILSHCPIPLLLTH
jgi:nucleotide-binding universal stress UspA family protein